MIGGTPVAITGQEPGSLQATVPPLEEVLRDLWQHVAATPVLEAVLILIIGLVFLLYGFKLYKWLVSVAYAIIGAILGGLVAANFGFEALIGIIAGALVLGILAWPLHRLAWGLLGAALFFVVAAVLMRSHTASAVYVYAVAGVAAVAGFALTLLVMRPLIILVTAVLGAAMIVQAALRLAMIQPTVSDPVVTMLQAKPYMLAILVGVPALLGIIIQWRDTKGAKAAGKPKKAEEGEE
jgi:hypothetical protein